MKIHNLRKGHCGQGGHEEIGMQYIYFKYEVSGRRHRRGRMLRAYVGHVFAGVAIMCCCDYFAPSVLSPGHTGVFVPHIPPAGLAFDFHREKRSAVAM